MNYLEISSSDLLHRFSDYLQAVREGRVGGQHLVDHGAIGAMIDEVLAANPAIVEEYRAGKQKAFNSLVGQIMKAARGKANPQQVNDLLKQKLDS